MTQTNSLHAGDVFTKLKHASIIIGCGDIFSIVNLRFQLVLQTNLKLVSPTLMNHIYYCLRWFYRKDSLRTVPIIHVQGLPG